MSYRVLIVEDDKAIRNILSLALEDSGYSCVPTASGEEAIQLITEKKSDFDLILVDLMLPGKNGAQVAWNARKTGLTGPIIAVSAQLSLWDRDDLIDCGFTHFLEKPFTNDQILELVTQTVQANS